ncbi:MAG: hypothetical protein ACI89U_002050, partial [Gammaproteobacteria bacterium]
QQTMAKECAPHWAMICKNDSETNSGFVKLTSAYPETIKHCRCDKVPSLR